MSGGGGETRGVPADPADGSRRPALVLAFASLAFLVLEARLIHSRGPIEWRAPETTVSNGPPIQRQDIPFFRFLRQVRRVLPEGATVGVLGPHAGTEVAPMDDLIAIGQLPGNDVVPVRAYLDRRIPPPRFLAVQPRDYSDDRYRVVAILESGRLYERKR
jgi:hypothetical protein